MLLKTILALFVFSSPLFAQTFVQSKSVAPTSASGTMASTSSVTAGNTIFVLYMNYAAGSTTAPTGSLTTTFVPIGFIYNPGGGSTGVQLVWNGLGDSQDTFIQVWMGIPSSSGVDTITYGGMNANNSTVIFEEWSGVSGVSVFGSTQSFSSTSSWALTNASQPLTSQAGVAVSFILDSHTATTCAYSAGTIREHQAPSGGETMCIGDAAVAAQTTPNAFTATWTLGASGNGSSGMLLLTPAAGGGGGGAVNSAYAQ